MSDRKFLISFDAKTDCKNKDFLTLYEALFKLDGTNLTENDFFQFLKQEKKWAVVDTKEFQSLCFMRALAKKIQEAISAKFEKTVQINVDETSHDILINDKVVKNYDEIVKAI